MSHARRLAFAALGLAAAAAPLGAQDSTYMRVDLLDGRSVRVRRAAAPAFAASAAASVVGEIVGTLGLKPNFRVEPVDDGSITNAAAGVDRGGMRYVVYNPRFLDDLNARTNRHAATLVLAHEVGHVLGAHSVRARLTDPAAARRDELEADEFAGGVLARLRIPLDSAGAVIAAVTGEADTPTHPGRRARLAAIRDGWCRAAGSGPACGGEAPLAAAPGAAATPAPAPGAARHAATLGHFELVLDGCSDGAGRVTCELRVVNRDGTGRAKKKFYIDAAYLVAAQGARVEADQARLGDKRGRIRGWTAMLDELVEPGRPLPLTLEFPGAARPGPGDALVLKASVGFTGDTRELRIDDVGGLRPRAPR